MAGIGNVFHVEFGFNDTELTRSLENKNWKLSERLIRENSQTSFLDEGAYQRIPLYICLCGRDEGWLDSVRPRNLYMARLLVEHGANVNFRIPESCMAEYVGPGHSAMELAVNLYNQVTCGEDVAEQDRWNQCSDPVIGFNKQIITDHEELVEQLCDLVFIMMGHGGDSNILDECKMTLLHRAVVYSSDLRLITLLCENGANLNAQDYRGNSPLVALCEGPTSEEDLYTDINNLEPKPNLIKQEFIKYLLALKDVQVNPQNRWGCTALFYCMLKGDLTSAALLLHAGADVTLKGKLCDLHTRPLSPLLVSMCAPKTLPSNITIDPCRMWTRPPSTHHLAHLVDSGYFSFPQVEAEVQLYCQGLPVLNQLPACYQGNSVATNMPQLASLGPSLLHLMFGGVTCSLKQLCVRRIVREYCFPQQASFSQDGEIQDPEASERPPFSEFAVETIDDEALLLLLRMLDLPKDLLINFQVCLLVQRLACQLSYAGRIWSQGSPRGDSDSDLYPSDENDSDLEYW